MNLLAIVVANVAGSVGLVAVAHHYSHLVADGKTSGEVMDKYMRSLLYLSPLFLPLHNMFMYPAREIFLSVNAACLIGYLAVVYGEVISTAFSYPKEAVEDAFEFKQSA